MQQWSIGKRTMTLLRQAWADLPPKLKILEPVQFSSDHWSLIERMHANFNDREAYTHLPMPIARFGEICEECDLQACDALHRRQDCIRR